MIDSAKKTTATFIVEVAEEVVIQPVTYGLSIGVISVGEVFSEDGEISCRDNCEQQYAENTQATQVSATFSVAETQP